MGPEGGWGGGGGCRAEHRRCAVVGGGLGVFGGGVGVQPLGEGPPLTPSRGSYWGASLGWFSSHEIEAESPDSEGPDS